MTEDEKKQDRVIKILLIIAVPAVVATMLWFVSTGYQDCSSEGGVYARTLIWFACIK